MSEDSKDAPARSAFTVDEFKSRLQRVREAMRTRGVDVLVATGPENIYYLSGYHTTGYHIYQALVVPIDGEPEFVCRKLEGTNVKALSWAKTFHPVDDTADPLAVTFACLEGLGAQVMRIGYEDRGQFLPPYILDGLRARFPKSSLVPASGIVEDSRMIKSPAEIALLRHSAEIAVAGIAAGVDAVKPGRTENDVVAAVYAGLVKAGSEYTGSPPFVTAGSGSARGHSTFEGNAIKAADTVWLEIGASHKRYSAGVGRTVAVGAPAAVVKKTGDLIIRAIEAMIQAIRPGATSGQVDRAGRSLVEDAGLGPRWLHRGGYALGISFPPGLGEGHIMDIKPGDARTLAPGMVFHLVPIVLIPGTGAIGCTETVLVTETGSEVLSRFPRELIQR